MNKHLHSLPLMNTLLVIQLSMTCKLFHIKPRVISIYIPTLTAWCHTEFSLIISPVNHLYTFNHWRPQVMLETSAEEFCMLVWLSYKWSKSHSLALKNKWGMRVLLASIHTGKVGVKKKIIISKEKQEREMGK